jgi:uncharacterized repeat protein (TIGR02543 family)
LAKNTCKNSKSHIGKLLPFLFVLLIISFVITMSGCLDSNVSEDENTINESSSNPAPSEDETTEMAYFSEPDDTYDTLSEKETSVQRILVPLSSGRKGSSSSSGSTSAPVLVNGITVTGAGSSTNVIITENLQMIANVLPVDATDKAVSWSVMNGTGNATIDTTGLLTGVALGTVTVKAIANDASGVEGTLVITVIEPPVLITDITVTGAGAATNVISGQTLQMEAMVLPANATDKTVIWSVVNGTGTAFIDSNGLLNAVNVGNVTVKAIANDTSGVEGTIEITIDPILVTGITVTGEGSATMVVNGQTLQMIAVVMPANVTDDSVTWSVIDGSGSATIDQNGLLTGTGFGTVTVKATANDASATEATCVITIAPMVYTVTFDSNGGDTEASPQIKNVAEGSTIDSLPNEPAMTGHTFEGWNTQSDGLGSSFTAVSLVTGDMTVYALWKPVTYTVTFDKNGGDTEASPFQMNADYGTTLSSLSAEPTKTGHTFEGWNTQSDGLGAAFTTSTIVTDNITVYAVWSPVTYTVTFDKNGGNTDASPSEMSADYGTTLGSLPAEPTKTGHTFEGWNTQSNGLGTTFADSTVITGDITVYAVWEPVTYKVTFDKNGGDTGASPSEMSADYGTTLGSLPAEPTKPGHTFEGWNTQSNSLGTVFTASTVVTDNVTVYAMWELATYTVIFDKNGGDTDATPTSKTAVYGTSVDSLPGEPTRIGHTFEGWNLQANGLGTAFTASTAISEDITVYAVWSPVTYTVTFDKNGGDTEASPTSKTADYGTSIDSLPAEPSKEDYTFEGWNTQADGLGTAFSASTIVTGDVTVYAVWKEIVLVPTGTLLDAEQGSDFTGVLYYRDNKLYYNQESNGKWTGESWVGNGTQGRIAIDGSDNVHAAYTTSDDKIGYNVFDGNSWATEVLIESNNFGRTGACSKADIAVDASGKAHITYTDTHGSTGDDIPHPDIMYANNTVGNFEKTLVYRGNQDFSSSGSWGADYFNKGSFITVDSNGNYLILAHKQNIWVWYADRYNNYYVVVKSSTDEEVLDSNYGSDTLDIYDLIVRDGKFYALYKHINVKSLELSTTGSAISVVGTTVADASSAYSHDLLSGDIVVGGKSGSNLQTNYNGVSTVETSITVGSNAVSVVNDGTNFYAFYTDSADQNIKKMLVAP